MEMWNVDSIFQAVVFRRHSYELVGPDKKSTDAQLMLIYLVKVTPSKYLAQTSDVTCGQLYKSDPLVILKWLLKQKKVPVVKMYTRYGKALDDTMLSLDPTRRMRSI